MSTSLREKIICVSQELLIQMEIHNKNLYNADEKKQSL